MHAVLLHRRSAAALTARLARRKLSDEPKRVTNLEIVRQNTARITYADGTTEDRDTRTLRQDDAATSAWMQARAALDATASEFACAALDESPFLSRAALLDRKLDGIVRAHVDTPATRFGQASEPLAVQAYRDKTGFEVRATGFYTCDPKVARSRAPRRPLSARAQARPPRLGPCRALEHTAARPTAHVAPPMIALE